MEALILLAKLVGALFLFGILAAIAIEDLKFHFRQRFLAHYFFKGEIDAYIAKDAVKAATEQFKRDEAVDGVKVDWSRVKLPGDGEQK